MQMAACRFRSLLHRSLSVFVRVHAHEVPSVLYSFFALFSLLGSYFLLLPLREDAGISLGTSSLPTLCACTLAVTLLFIPAASAFLSRSHPSSREVALQQFYFFMAAVLLVFYFLYTYAAIDSMITGASPHHLQHPQHWQQQHQHSKQGLLPVEPVGLTQQQQQHWSRQVLAHGVAVSLPDHSPAAAAAAAAPAHAVYQGLRLHISDAPSALEVPATHAFSRHGGQMPCHARCNSSSISGSPSVMERASETKQQVISYPPAAAGAAPGIATGMLRQLQQVQKRGATAEPGPASAMVNSYDTSYEGIANISDSSNKRAGDSSSSSSSSSSRRRAVSSRHGDPALSRPQRLLRGAFYVWVNVMNLVCISSLWVRCADAFTPEAGARLFGFISAGATLGQLMGSLMAMLVAWAAELVVERASSSSGTASSGDAAAPASGLILGSAVLQLLAAQLVCRVRPSAAAGAVHSVTAAAGAAVHVHATGHNAAPAAAAADIAVSAGQESCILTANSRDGLQLKRRVSDAEKGTTFKLSAAAALAAVEAEPAAANQAALKQAEAPSSGSGRSLPEQLGLRLCNVLVGFRMILHSRYLLMLCGNLLLTYVVGSLMYFQRALVVSTSMQGPSQRTAFFAVLNTWSAACILLMQLFATSSLLRHLGMQAALGLGPLICLAGILSISSSPSPAMVAMFEVVRKVFAYAVYRPSREVLFTVVSRDEKYSAKLVIDTVVQRLGDALAAAAFQVLDVQWSLGQAGVGAAGVAMCFLWLATAHKLGQHHKRLAKADTAVRGKMAL